VSEPTGGNQVALTLDPQTVEREAVTVESGVVAGWLQDQLGQQLTVLGT
jgi:hypothetical protein